MSALREDELDLEQSSVAESVLHMCCEARALTAPDATCVRVWHGTHRITTKVLGRCVTLSPAHTIATAENGRQAAIAQDRG